MVPGTILPPSNVHSCLMGFMLNRARGSVSTHCAHGEHLDITPPLNSHCLLCQRDPSVKVMLVKNDTRDCKEIKVKELIKKNDLQKRRDTKRERVSSNSPGERQRPSRGGIAGSVWLQGFVVRNIREKRCAGSSGWYDWERHMLTSLDGVQEATLTL